MTTLLIVKYVSPGCGPCHTLKPILNKVVDEFDGKIHFVEIDIEQDRDIAELVWQERPQFSSLRTKSC